MSRYMDEHRQLACSYDLLGRGNILFKVAEIVITKRRITEKKKLDIDIRTEEVTIKYPDGRSEKLS